MKKVLAMDVKVESVGAIGQPNINGWVPCRMILTFDTSQEIATREILDKLAKITYVEIPISTNSELNDL